MKLHLSLVVLLALAACARSSEPDPTPTEDGGPYDMIDPTAAPVGTQPNLVAPAIGTWRQAQLRGQPALLFSSSAGAPALALLCDERKGLVIERRGVLPTGERDLMEIRFGSATGSYAVNQPVDGEVVLRAAIPFNDRMLAQLRETQAPLTVRVGEGEPLTLPADPAVGTLVRTCQQSG